MRLAVEDLIRALWDADDAVIARARQALNYYVHCATQAAHRAAA